MSDGRKKLARAGKFFLGWLILTGLILTVGGWLAGWVAPQLFFVALFTVAAPWSIGVLLAVILVTVLAVIGFAVMQYYAKTSEEIIVAPETQEVKEEDKEEVQEETKEKAEEEAQEEVQSEVTTTLPESPQQIRQEPLNIVSQQTQSGLGEEKAVNNEEDKNALALVTLDFFIPTAALPPVATPLQSSKPQDSKVQEGTPTIDFGFDSSPSQTKNSTSSMDSGFQATPPSSATANSTFLYSPSSDKEVKMPTVSSPSPTPPHSPILLRKNQVNTPVSPSKFESKKNSDFEERVATNARLPLSPKNSDAPEALAVPKLRYTPGSLNKAESSFKPTEENLYSSSVFSKENNYPTKTPTSPLKGAQNSQSNPPVGTPPLNFSFEKSSTDSSSGTPPILFDFSLGESATNPSSGTPPQDFGL